MARFGGWEARWLASVIMMQGQGREVDNGMLYERDTDRMIIDHDVETPHTRKSVYLSTGSKWRSKLRATVYLVGLVDIDEQFLELIVPDPEKRAWLMKGNQDEFFK